jgi:hypothetical protein
MTDRPHLTVLRGGLTVTLADLDRAARHAIAAEQAAGWLYVSLLHGDLETPADEHRLNLLRRVVHSVDFALPDGQPTCVAYRGGNDWSTWCLRGPFAGHAQRAIIGRITELAPCWWRWSTEPTPPRGLTEGASLANLFTGPLL